jgi:cell wall assembly regulator SMI1
MAKEIQLAVRSKPPCGPACVEGAWKRLETWYREHCPDILDGMGPGATPEEVRAVEQTIGRSLPEELRQSFAIRNGVHEGCLSNLDFLTLEQVLNAWNFWDEYCRLDAFRNLSREWCTSIPRNAIRLDLYDRDWVPLVSGPVMNHLGIDLDPGTEGLPGQVINFGYEQDRKAVLAWTWGWFLTDLAEELERGNFQFHERSGLMLRNPPDHFLSVVDDWSKAKTGGRRPTVEWAIDPTWLAWNDGTVLRLAQSIAEERAFDRLPILADALEDAGSTDTELLEHLRDTEIVHGKECWAINAILAQP